MPRCPHCGNEFSGRARYCSERCKKAAAREAKSAATLTHIRHCPLVDTIVRHALRDGVNTMSIVAGVKLEELNYHLTHIRNQRYATGCKLQLSHFISAIDQGQLSPDNLGLWPDWLNQKLGKRSLQIGVKVPDKHWNNANLQCYTADEAYNLLDKMHGKTLRKLALSGELQAPYRMDSYNHLVNRGYAGSFTTVHRLRAEDFEALCLRYNIKPPAVNELKPDTFALRELLKHELVRQARLYPKIYPKLKPFLHGLSDFHDVVAVDILALATIHDFTEAKRLMNNYNPHEHDLQSPSDDQPYAVETVRWKDTDGRWNTTEIPHPDFYNYNPMDF